ncbi:hypothetical protein [Amycolatopsis sp. NPDC059657]|uniref:hypothetical protein n=1 Tax=Amycolatopsis sp. NPDC059657 TaxID=3346899 RepID=UPI00366C85DB
MTVDPRFEKLLAERGLLDLDGLMRHDGYYAELPLFTEPAQVSFLDGLPPEDRNRAAVRAAVAHLGRIIDHAKADFAAAVTVTGWDHEATPHFWLANPSHGVFGFLRVDPPGEGSKVVEGWLDHDPGYTLNDEIPRVPAETWRDRVFVQRNDLLFPRHVRLG